MPSLSEYQDFLNKAGIGNSGAGSMKIQGAPYNFQLAGNVRNGYLDFVGSNGYYWSSMAHDPNQAYNLYFDSGEVGVLVNNYRYYGFSVRCIAP